MSNNEIVPLDKNLFSTLLDKNDLNQIQSLCRGVHPVDLADAIKNLTLDEATTILTLLDQKQASELVIALDDNTRSKILENLNDTQVAKQLDVLDTDDAADLLSEIPQERVTNIIKSVEDTLHANNIIELLRFDEDTAGGLMGKELVSVNEEWDIKTSLREIKNQAENVQKIYSVYVVDNHLQLKGRVSIKDILTKSQNLKIKEICIPELMSVSLDEKAEDIANIMGKYDLESVPVINELGRLVGRITIDDIVDVIKEEAERDYQLAAGITTDIEHDDSLLKTVRARLPWLIIGSAGGIGAAVILTGFIKVINQYPVLLAFVPLLQATAGNVGVQASAIIVQTLARKELKDKIFMRLGREVLLGLVNGLFISVMVVLLSITFFEITPKEMAIVGITTLTIIVNSGLIGSLIPYLLNKIKIDPALATGPFITTSADILGITIYFAIAKWILF